MISICREHSSNVTRWRDGTMALRWGAALSSAQKRFQVARNIRKTQLLR